MSDYLIDDTRQEVIRLLTKQRQELLEQLLCTPDLLRSQRQDQQQRNLNREDVEQWQDILKGEAYKTERMEVTFAVVGTMKAGKSTTINAIVGTEVMPNRNQPMTTLPTIIRHVPGKREPELFFPNPGPFNNLVAKLQHELSCKKENGQFESIAFCATEDGKELVAKILDGSVAAIRQSYKGTEEIFAFLKDLNDIWRLGNSDGIEVDIDVCLDEYNQIHEFPTIEVEFFHLRDQNGERNRGQFTLIDSPGPNEAGQTFLKHIVRDQLEHASAVLAVLDYTQLNAEADAEMRRALEELGQCNDRVFVLVNKFDQKDRHGMDADELKAYVVKDLFHGRLDADRVHPVSSKYGYLANRALCELANSGHLPDPRFQPWVEDFGLLALGACWESEIEDFQEVEYRANKLWKSSLFDKPLTEVIKKGSENSALISLKSAVGKMLDYDRKIVEGLQVRQRAITTDKKLIEEHIKSLEVDVSLVKEGQADARRKIDESIKALEVKIKELFGRCEEVAKKEVQSIFSCAQSNNWITRRLAGFIDLTPSKKSIDISFDAKGYNDFETETEARLFLNKIIDAVAGYIEPVLDDMQHAVQQAVDEMAEDIWASVNRRLAKVLKAAEERLHESFSLAIEFPKSRVRSVKVDFARLRQDAVREGTITKTGVKYERRWYTLWCRRHEATYQYQEKVFRVHTMEIAKQLQRFMEEDYIQIEAALDKYVQKEFGMSLNSYFTEIANYLERFRGDLLDSKRDRELETDKLENLQDAMGLLYKMAAAHRQDVEAVAEGLGEESPDRVGVDAPQAGLRLVEKCAM